MRFRSALAEIPAYIDSLAATLVASDAINIAMWPIDRTTNQDVHLSYADAVARLKQAYTEKYQWLDNIIINTY
jgi:inosine-uridine nucleoside N-ribohydrolase